MLNVPDEVKALFKQDGVRKNFRVHFPNGELPDITNENIVQESVKFTESICSQDVLKFGLTEASVIEFETVGIANMYGMTIECGIEIDLSSLTPAQLNDIASGTWDGVYTDAGSSDIGYAYFRVPYGVFRIESCPRDHQAMTHRKVQAYGGKIENSTSFEPQYDVLNTMTRYDSYKMNPKDVFAVCAAGSDTSVLSDLGYQETQLTFTNRNISSSPSLCIWDNLDGDTNKRVQLEIAPGVRKEVEFSGIEDGIIITSFDVEKYSLINEFYSEMHDKYDSRSDDFTESSYYGLNYVFPLFTFGVWEYSGGSGTRTLDNLRDCRIYPKSGVAIAPFGRMPKNASASLVPTALLYVRDTVTINEVVYQGAYVIETISHTFNLGAVTASKWDSSFDDGIRLQLEPTLKGYYYDTQYLNSFANAVSLVDIMQGYSELFAQFITQDRFGDFKYFHLNNTTSVAVIPEMYSGLWWDEYEVLPIGRIKYAFGDNEVYTYNFGSGLSTYDMTDNPILTKMANASVTTINTLLRTYFIPHLAPIAFTPIELNMKGFPYMEAGDYLAIATEDGTIANSFNMRQEINGIQVLTATIESTSGDIIESGEST